MTFQFECKMSSFLCVVIVGRLIRVNLCFYFSIVLASSIVNKLLAITLFVC